MRDQVAAFAKDAGTQNAQARTHAARAAADHCGSMENLQACWNHACLAEALAARCRGYCGHAAKPANQSKASFTLAQQSRGTAKAFAQVAEFHAGKAAGHDQATDTHRMSALVSAYEADGSAKTVATQLEAACKCA